jgi:hypothetical protein
MLLQCRGGTIDRGIRDTIVGGGLNSDEGYIRDYSSKINQSNNISHTINMEKQNGV